MTGSVMHCALPSFSWCAVIRRWRPCAPPRRSVPAHIGYVHTAAGREVEFARARRIARRSTSPHCHSHHAVFTAVRPPPFFWCSKGRQRPHSWTGTNQVERGVSLNSAVELVLLCLVPPVSRVHFPHLPCAPCLQLSAVLLRAIFWPGPAAPAQKSPTNTPKCGSPQLGQ